jgi:hypothetical protein
MITSTPRGSRAKRVLHNEGTFTNTWAPRKLGKVSPPGKPIPVELSKAQCVSKSLCPSNVPNVNILCSAQKIGSVLDGSQCLVTGCRGLRRIQSVDAETHGGCAVFQLICRTCKTMDLWESGTHYEAVKGDPKTCRYAEATLLVIGTMFGGGGQASYEEVCSAIGVYGFSANSNFKYRRASQSC